MAKRKTYTVGGIPIQVIEHGDPGLQKAILIHGWSSSSFAVSPLVRPLSRRFHCLAVELPGYGGSPAPQARVTIPFYAELLAQLIREVSPSGPVVLVGHSMGGMIAVSLALRRPSLVERMVLLCPTISGHLSTAINLFISPITIMERFGLGSMIVSNVERTFVGLTDRLMRPVSFAARSTISKADYIRLRADARRPGQGRVRAECFWAMRANDLRGRLGQVSVPALIIWGAEDNTVPLRDAGVIADEWPQADLRILPKAGHWPHFEQPLTTERLVTAYLGVPRLKSEAEPITAQELSSVQEVAQFLAHSDIGDELTQAQRTRLAAQFRQRLYRPGDKIAGVSQTGDELYLVHYGTVEIWRDVEERQNGTVNEAYRRLSVLRPGVITGEISLFDQGGRSADMIAGPQGAVVLSLDRARLLALCDEDAILGVRVLWNIAQAMSRRIRYILWQLDNSTDAGGSQPSPEPLLPTTPVGRRLRDMV